MSYNEKTLQNLNPNIRYAARVRAISRLGVISPWSEALEFRTSKDESIPTPPSDLIIDFTTMNVLISWTAPDTNVDGSALMDIHHYEVTLTASGISKVYETTQPYFLYNYQQNVLDFVTPQSMIGVQVRTVDTSNHKSAPAVGTALNPIPPNPANPPQIIAGFSFITVIMDANGIQDWGSFKLEYSDDNGFTWIHHSDPTTDSVQDSVDPGSERQYRYKIRDVFGQLSTGFSSPAFAVALSLSYSNVNLLVNSSLENGSDVALAWSRYDPINAHTYSIDTAVKLYQNKSQKIVAIDNITLGISQVVSTVTPTLANTWVTASFWVQQTSGPAKSAQVRVINQDTNDEYTSPPQSLTLNKWVRVVFSVRVTAPANYFVFQAFIESPEADDVFYIDGAQLQFATAPTDYQPTVLEIPGEYIVSENIANLAVDKLISGIISAAVITMKDNGKIQSFNFGSGTGYQITNTGATFQNGSLTAIGAGGTTTFDSTSFRAIYSGNTQFLINSSGVFIGGPDASTAEIYVDTAASKTIIQGNTLFQSSTSGYAFEVDLTGHPGAGPSLINRVLRLYPTTDTTGASDTFYLKSDGSAFFGKGIINLTGGSGGFFVDAAGNVTIGTGANSLHVDTVGNMWLGGSSFATALFKVSNTGTMTAGSGTFSGSLSSASGTFNGTVTAGQIDGGIITGSIFRTALSGQRIEISPGTNLSQIYFYGASGTPGYLFGSAGYMEMTAGVNSVRCNETPGSVSLLAANQITVGATMVVIDNSYQLYWQNGTTIITQNNVQSTFKNFRIAHPIPELSETTDLMYTSIEAPTFDLYHRGRVQLSDGKASVDLDQQYGLTPGTYKNLCGTADTQVMLYNETGENNPHYKFSGSKLDITCKDKSATIAWVVISERKDKGILESDLTSKTGKLVNEQPKSIPPVEKE